MQSVDSEILQVEQDDWGEFGDIIKQLEKQEAHADSTDNNALSADDEAPSNINAEAFEGFLGIIFTVAEQATSIISGVEFAFDEKGKNEVINSAVPVLSKHGGELMRVFGGYIEEATLFIAVLALVYSSKRHLNTLKAQKMEEMQREKEKATAAQAA